MSKIILCVVNIFFLQPLYSSKLNKRIPWWLFIDPRTMAIPGALEESASPVSLPIPAINAHHTFTINMCKIVVYSHLQKVSHAHNTMKSVIIKHQAMQSKAFPYNPFFFNDLELSPVNLKLNRFHPPIIGNFCAIFDQNTFKDFLSITFKRLFQYLLIKTLTSDPENQ